MSNKARRFEPSFSAAFAQFRGESHGGTDGSTPFRICLSPGISPTTGSALLRVGLPFFKSLFRRWKPDASTTKPSVILMADCFSCFYDSDLAWRRSNSWKRSDTKWSGRHWLLWAHQYFGRKAWGGSKDIEQTAPALEELRERHSAVVLSHWNHLSRRDKKTGQN